MSYVGSKPGEVRALAGKAISRSVWGRVWCMWSVGPQPGEVGALQALQALQLAAPGKGLLFTQMQVVTHRAPSHSCLLVPALPALWLALQTLHVGDRFTLSGNDTATRDMCSVLWVANPEETGFFIKVRSWPLAGG